MKDSEHYRGMARFYRKLANSIGDMEFNTEQRERYLRDALAAEQLSLVEEKVEAGREPAPPENVYITRDRFILRAYLSNVTYNFYAPPGGGVKPFAPTHICGEEVSVVYSNPPGEYPDIESMGVPLDRRKKIVGEKSVTLVRWGGMTLHQPNFTVHHVVTVHQVPHAGRYQMRLSKLSLESVGLRWDLHYTWEEAE